MNKQLRTAVSVALGVASMVILNGCTTLVQYEGVWITPAEKAKIEAYQHRVFDLGIYDDDLSMSVHPKDWQE